MTVMVLLRIFADLGFYYAFAATVSSALGGRFHFPALLLLAACYAACCRFREQKRRQRLVLALAALAVLLPAPWGGPAGLHPGMGVCGLPGPPGGPGPEPRPAGGVL